MALHAVRATGHPRKALVVISDGADNASRYTEKELAALVVESDVQIYTIGIAESLAHRDERQGLSLLQDLSEMSGGLHFTVRHRAALPDAAAKATRAMKSLYMLAYRPPEGSPAGKWRKIKVAPAPGLNRAVRISAKTGYFEPD
jgi:Ca-activated chloride channel family protein